MTATAAAAIWPYPHRTVAEADADEARWEANSVKASLTRPCPRCGAKVGVNCYIGNQIYVGSHNERRLSR